MSAISGSRAAVFTQPSQNVEVFLEGDWRPGALLGWRHDGGGSCEVWVRVTVDGADRETWTDLAEVRLPEPRSVPAPDTGADPFAGLAEELLPGASAAPLLSLSEAAAREQRVAGVLPSTGPFAPRRRRRHGGDVTAEMPAVQGARRPAGTGPRPWPAATGRSMHCRSPRRRRVPSSPTPPCSCPAPRTPTA